MPRRTTGVGVASYLRHPISADFAYTCRMWRRDPAKLGSIALWPGILVALLFLVAQVTYWAVQIRPAYFPAGDEFALLVSSTRFFHPHPGDWFRHGFSGYFCPYPDLSLPYSNFLRPMANFTYYLQSFVFGRHWGDYLLGTYVIEAAAVITVWYLARMCLRLPPSVSLRPFHRHGVIRRSFDPPLRSICWGLSGRCLRLPPYLAGVGGSPGFVCSWRC